MTLNGVGQALHEVCAVLVGAVHHAHTAACVEGAHIGPKGVQVTMDNIRQEAVCMRVCGRGVDGSRDGWR
jgi:hypothetical protein